MGVRSMKTYPFLNLLMALIVITIVCFAALIKTNSSRINRIESKLKAYHQIMITQDSLLIKAIECDKKQ